MGLACSRRLLPSVLPASYFPSDGCATYLHSRPFSSERKHVTKLVFSLCYLSVILGTAYLHPRLSLCYLSVIPGKTPAALTWRENEADLNFCRQHTEQKRNKILGRSTSNKFNIRQKKEIHKAKVHQSGRSKAT
uniref:Uncharacterized protein n=1 Tax=Triticum urartu TaxID=4572 RepID=A0A8R7V1T1_TRIUA